MTEFSLTKEEKEQYKDNIIEIFASMPEINATSTEEIRKAMEKVENEGT